MRLALRSQQDHYETAIKSRRRGFGEMSIIFSASRADADNSPFGLGF